MNLLIKTSILIGLYYLQIALLKRAVEKFKSQLGADSASILSENSPKNSLTYHRITPISPSYQTTSEGQKGKDYSINGRNTYKIVSITLLNVKPST